jgi:ubiquinone/menaquinone biosynthesis C-methylase UbiE
MVHSLMPIWAEEPDAWARIEEQQLPTYEAALNAAGLGAAVLDVGCGTGVFLRLCADRGASVAGLDATERLLARARRRVPEADLRLGDMQALPFADDAFDLVTGFTSFFYADDPAAALREAARVARGRVVVHTFGHPERCDVPIDAGWRPEIVAAVATQAGLTVERSFYLRWAYADGTANEWQIVVTASSRAR